MLCRSQDDPEAEVNDAGDDVDGLGKDRGEGSPGTAGVSARMGIAVSRVPPLSHCHRHGTEGLCPRDAAISPPAIWAVPF